MKSHGITAPLPCCFALRVLPVRALTLADEAALVQGVGELIESRGWRWEGTQLWGTVVSDGELTLGEVVDMVGLLLADPRVARVEASAPQAFESDGEELPRLRVHRSCAHALTLCELHRLRLLDAGSVIRALGGFVWPAPAGATGRETSRCGAAGARA